MLQAYSNNSRKFLSKKGEKKNLVIHKDANSFLIYNINYPDCSQLIGRPHQVHQHTQSYFLNQ